MCAAWYLINKCHVADAPVSTNIDPNRLHHSIRLTTLHGLGLTAVWPSLDPNIGVAAPKAAGANGKELPRALEETFCLLVF
jgi:hypothetical protein